jgi:uncharacterized membrane protein
MSFEPSTVKRTILAGVAAVALTLAANVGYGLAFRSWRSMSRPEALHEIRAGAPYLVLGLFLAAVGAILGARLATYRSDPRPWLTGLAAGAGLALVVIAVGWLRGRLDFWLPPNAAMAVVGGWLGGWFAGQA